MVFWQQRLGVLVRHGIEILTIPKVRLFSLKNPHERIFIGSRRLNDEHFREVARSLEIQPVEIRLDFAISDEKTGLGHEDVEQIFRNYTTLKTDHRAVLLLDIVGFSKHTPETQASQLSTLEFALNIAEESCRQKLLPIEMKRSTTGDGFYVWNKKSGPDADIALFVLMSLFLTYYAGLKRVIREKDATLELRTAAGIGSHYTFYNPGRNVFESEEYIVGDVTISVARIIGKARANQIIVNAFNRPGHDTKFTYSAETLLALAGRELEKFHGMSLFGNAIDRFAFYLTGPKRQNGSFLNQRMRVIDKHGFEHLCYNAKVNVFVDAVEPYFSGLQHSELAGKRAPPAPVKVAAS
ncbi:MAG: hypothetical protein O2985_10325 [Proteobacteria bacterium]|nr:hypothetical protein [Pseudomonadota bacterium]